MTKTGTLGTQVRPLHLLLTSAASLKDTVIPLIKHWLKLCTNDHLACQYLVNSSLPTRILYLGGCDSSKVFLQETSGEVAPYMAMSYCWGTTSFLNLASDNVEALKGGIDVDRLPLSIQHAIDVARCLDVKYLWIDALCIIQNDLHDWEVQSPKMAEVYRGSHLVLATTKLADPSPWLLEQSGIGNSKNRCHTGIDDVPHSTQSSTRTLLLSSPGTCMGLSREDLRSTGPSFRTE